MTEDQNKDKNQGIEEKINTILKLQKLKLSLEILKIIGMDDSEIEEIEVSTGGNVKIPFGIDGAKSSKSLNNSDTDAENSIKTSDLLYEDKVKYLKKNLNMYLSPEGDRVCELHGQVDPNLIKDGKLSCDDELGGFYTDHKHAYPEKPGAPVVTIEVPIAKIRDVSAVNNVGTWGEMGENPNKDIVNISIISGEYEIKETLSE